MKEKEGGGEEGKERYEKRKNGGKRGWERGRGRGVVEDEGEGGGGGGG